MSVVKDIVGVVVGVSMSYYLYRWAGGVLSVAPPATHAAELENFDFQ